jgi:hypothetical protein
VIVTVTPNPGLDRTIEVGRLRRGQLHRSYDLRLTLEKMLRARSAAGETDLAERKRWGFAAIDVAHERPAVGIGVKVDILRGRFGAECACDGCSDAACHRIESFRFVGIWLDSDALVWDESLSASCIQDVL